MKRLFSHSFVAIAFLSAGLFSCKKDTVESPVKTALMAHTWRVENVTEYNTGVPTVNYQRGAQNNSDDYSLVRQKYNSNGTIQYVDQFGSSGNNGTYQLLDNDRKLKIGFAGLTTTVESLKVTASEFAYTLKVGDNDSLRFVFSPL
jgi:hypothetical protein